MTKGQKLYYVTPTFKLEEYTYLNKLPMLETKFNSELDEELIPLFEQHLIADSCGCYEMISTADLRVRYFLTRKEAVQAKVDEVNQLLELLM